MSDANQVITYNSQWLENEFAVITIQAKGTLWNSR